MVAEELDPAVANALPEGATTRLASGALLLRGGYCAAASYCSAAKDRPLVSGFKCSEFPDRCVLRIVCSLFPPGASPPRLCAVLVVLGLALLKLPQVSSLSDAPLGLKTPLFQVLHE